MVRDVRGVTIAVHVSNNSRRCIPSPVGSSVSGGGLRGSCGGSRLSRLYDDARRSLCHGVAGSGSRVGRADPMADMHWVLQHTRSLHDIDMKGGDKQDHADSDEADDIDTPHRSNTH
ncbi:hypothetical protein L1887_14825 [Cichorium endivia]|nr:hypothetical protein L1887_14825 [Cichorium endivia]